MATYSFQPPVVFEASRYRDPELKWMERYKWPRGVCLVWDGASFFETRTLHEAHYSGKQDGHDYFIGGNVYSGLSQETADRLISSGYGDRLEEE